MPKSIIFAEERNVFIKTKLIGLKINKLILLILINKLIILLILINKLIKLLILINK